MTTTVPEQGDTAQAPDPREEYIQGLESLIQLLREHPELPVPYAGTNSDLAVFIDAPGAVEKALVFMNAMDEEPGVKLNHSVPVWVDVKGNIGGVRVALHMRAVEICERAVAARYTGTDGQMHEVTEWQIPATLLAAVRSESEGEVSRG